MHGLTPIVTPDILKSVYIQVRDNWKAHPLCDYSVGDDDLEMTLHEAFGDLLFLEDNQITIHVHLCQE